MGYIRHDLTVIGAIDTEIFPDRNAAAVGRAVDQLRVSIPPQFAALIVGPVSAVVNGDVWWVMLPDGSKEGWSTSKEGERYRAMFAALAPYGAVGLRWGDEEAAAYEDGWQPIEDDEPALDGPQRGS